jgi:hypothetical protein
MLKKVKGLIVKKMLLGLVMLGCVSSEYAGKVDLGSKQSKIAIGMQAFGQKLNPSTHKVQYGIGGGSALVLATAAAYYKSPLVRRYVNDAIRTGKWSLGIACDALLDGTSKVTTVSCDFVKWVVAGIGREMDTVGAAVVSRLPEQQ